MDELNIKIINYIYIHDCKFNFSSNHYFPIFIYPLYMRRIRQVRPQTETSLARYFLRSSKRHTK